MKCCQIKWACLCAILFSLISSFAAEETSFEVRVAALRSEKAEDRLRAARELRQMGIAAMPATDALIESLSDSDWRVAEVSRSTVAALARHALPKLVSALQSAQPRQRAAAVRALGLCSPLPESAVDAIRAAAEADADRTVRVEALRALGSVRQNAQELVPILIRELNGADPEVSAVACEALAALGPQGSVAAPEIAQRLTKATIVHERLLLLRTLQASRSDDLAVSAAVLRCLQDSDARVRENAARFVQAVLPRNAETIPELTKAVKDKNAEVRRAAIEALGALGPRATEAIPTLVGTLHETYWFACEDAAAKALASMGEPAVLALLDVASQPEQERAQAAMAALKTIVDRDASALFSALKSGNPELRASALRVSNFAADFDAMLPALLDSLADSSTSVRAAAAEVLAVRGPGILIHIKPALTDERWLVRAGVVSLLAHHGSSSNVLVQEELLAAALDAHPEVRRNAFRGLKDVSARGPKITEALTNGLRDEQIGVRLEVASAIEGLGGNSEHASLLIVLLKSNLANARAAAAAALGHCEADSALLLNELSALLNDSSHDVRAAVLRGLSKLELKDPKVREKIYPALQDASALVRAEAIACLGVKGDVPEQIKLMSIGIADKEGRVRIQAMKMLTAESRAQVEVINLVAKMLDDPQESVRKQCVETLAVCGRNGAAILPKALLDSSDFVKQVAFQVLRKSDENGAGGLNELIRVFKSENPRAQQMALWLLKEIRPVEARTVDALNEVLVSRKGSDDFIRQVVIVLGEFGPLATSATQTLKNAMQDETFKSRAVVGTALAHIGADQDLLALLKHEKPNVRALAAKSIADLKDWSGKVIDSLCVALEDSDAATRENASAALAKAGTPALTKVAELLQSNDDFSRGAALRILKQWGPVSAPASDFLTKLLSGPDSKSAAEALHSIGEGAVPSLLNALENPQAETRWWSAGMLGTSGGDAKVRILALIKMMEDPEARVREVGIVALGRIGQHPELVVPALKTRLLDPTPAVATAAVRALAEYGEIGLPVIVEALSGSRAVRSAASRALTHPSLPADAVVKALCQLLSETNSLEVKYEVVSAIGIMGGRARRAIPQLLPYAAEKDALLAASARIALESAGSPHPEDLSVITPFLKSENKDLRIQAGLVLSRLKVLPELLVADMLSLLAYGPSDHDGTFARAVLTCKTVDLEEVRKYLSDRRRWLVRHCAGRVFQGAEGQNAQSESVILAFLREYHAAQNVFVQKVTTAEYARHLWGAGGLYSVNTGVQLIREAAARADASREMPEPFHGYVFRVLQGQGKNSLGGEKSYIVNGLLKGGHALFAYPVRQSEGRPCFVIHLDGSVYVRESFASMETLKVFDADENWRRVPEALFGLR